jgi:hypothetical protein
MEFPSRVNHLHPQMPRETISKQAGLAGMVFRQNLYANLSFNVRRISGVIF